MPNFEYKIDSRCHGMTIKTFLRLHLGLSARAVKDLKYKGNISINAERENVTRAMSQGEILELWLPEEKLEYPILETELSILFEDESFLIVDKPAAMPVHPSPGHDCDSLLNAVAYHNLKSGQSYMFRPLYRLDRDTTGILVIAKNIIAASSVQVDKTYFAVCRGKTDDAGKLDFPIALKPDSKIVRRVSKDAQGAQKAVTHYQRVDFDGENSLVAVKLETGRTHQIRVHFSHIGHPLLGDELYGGGDGRIESQLLHCGALKLNCRAINLEKQFVADFPNDMRKAFKKKIRMEELMCRQV